jgi:hypothetical protein
MESYRYLRFGEIFGSRGRSTAIALETEALPSMGEKKPLGWAAFAALAYD